jgi:hypothetical protein
MSTAYPEIFAALAAEFEPREVKSRSQAGRTFRYVTARTIMNRLDSVLGPENWFDDYTMVGENSCICWLTIHIGDLAITKVDAGGSAGMSDAGDDDKSMVSDAFKRAAVKFGPGRYLYGDGVPSFLAAWTPPQSALVKSPAPPPLAKPVIVPPAPAPTPKTKRPTTGPELLAYAATNKIDPGLEQWLVDNLCALGYPTDIATWTTVQVTELWPMIRRRLERVKLTAEMINPGPVATVAPRPNGTAHNRSNAA